MNIRNYFCTALVAVVVAGCGGGSGSSSGTTTTTTDGTTTGYQYAYRACESGTQITYLFGSNGAGTGTRTISQFAATDCSGTATSTTTKDFTYVWGEYDSDSDLKPLDITEDGVTLYTIAEWITPLFPHDSEGYYFGAPPPISSEGMDGTTAEKRYDQLSTVYYYHVE